MSRGTSYDAWLPYVICLNYIVVNTFTLHVKDSPKDWRVVSGGHPAKKIKINVQNQPRGSICSGNLSGNKGGTKSTFNYSLQTEAVAVVMSQGVPYLKRLFSLSVHQVHFLLQE